SHSQALLAVGKSLKAPTALQVPKTGKAVFEIAPKWIQATLQRVVPRNNTDRATLDACRFSNATIQNPYPGARLSKFWNTTKDTRARIGRWRATSSLTSTEVTEKRRKRGGKSHRTAGRFNFHDFLRSRVASRFLKCPVWTGLKMYFSTTTHLCF
ncbi:unnamed protein product, partial [Ixodes pacificus]